ncbi:ATP-dependent helicase [Mycolicibacterium fluoranthenivorans]|uniref:DNA 3'-5' helicase n=1 Tax=Mycolicibacterium fluoranthenivorans TaxID=258505 RepID=A0A7G8PAI8_9MYCO|nr:UvrD-helicase domain-containing protein [Mycolicibacterium fluoranthenivorans]QNJ91354.1 ATP-dependent helicase [Mycolicibacterium fluoranthenivorans]
MNSRVGKPDTAADEEIQEVLDRATLTGFTVVAGAGSGKTTSLVKALAHITRTRGRQLKSKTQRVACITYTEVAAREIHGDIDNDPLASVSTIHSFLWGLARPFQRDISLWAEDETKRKITELTRKIDTYTSGIQQKTKGKDAEDLARLIRQAEEQRTVTHWTYGIGGDFSKGILGHTDIIQLVPSMIHGHKLLALLIARQYPYIFVDESQDTFPQVVECLKRVASISSGKMCLGFFGDPMQQIYLQGAGKITTEPGWVSINKPENFRSSLRVLKCVNAVRKEGGEVEQVPGPSIEKRQGGEAYFFILPANDQRTESLEHVRVWLDKHSAAGNWTRSDANGGCKVLMIVHRMAAQRLGFAELYSAFHDHKSGSLSQAFDEGSAWPLAPFRDVILPLCTAIGPTSPEVLSLLRDQSPLFEQARASRQIRQAMEYGRIAVTELQSLTTDDDCVTLGSLLRFAADKHLVQLDPRLASYLYPEGEHGNVVLGEAATAVLEAMMECPFNQLPGYYRYVNAESPYSTQHGTKGAEFDRVVVVLDDEEGRFNLYSYEKLLGLQSPSKTDLQNQAEGKDSAIDRTRRLFYVCVSRAKESLAVVLFARDVDTAVGIVGDSRLGKLMKIVTIDDLND